jgi:hypothetical protein
VSSLRDQLCQYIDHVGDRRWIATILETAGPEAALETIADVVRHGHPREVQDALTFARDVGVYGLVPREVTDAIRAHAPTLLYPALAEGLHAERYLVRSNVVHTIGMLFFEEQASLLLDAFERSVARDPLLLPSLLFELFWLLGAPYWTLVERVLASPCYLSRWAMVEVLRQYERPEGGEFEPAWYYCQALVTDPHPLVRAEGEHRRAAMERARVLTERPNTRRRRAVLAPLHTFTGLTRAFREGWSDPYGDYAVEQFDAFVRERTAPR